MTVQSNPRKVGKTGGMTYISMPADVLEESGIEHEDQVILTAEDGEILVEPVEWTVSTDE